MANEERGTLLPCPWCEGDAELKVLLLDEDCHIECRDCHSRSGRYRTAPEAIAAWNTRAATATVSRAVMIASADVAAANERAEGAEANSRSLKQIPGVWICSTCGNMETREREVVCWKCGKGEMNYWTGEQVNDAEEQVRRLSGPVSELKARCHHDFVRHLFTSARLSQYPIVSDELILIAMGVAAQGIEGLGEGPCQCGESDCPYRPALAARAGEFEAEAKHGE